MNTGGRCLWPSDPKAQVDAILDDPVRRPLVTAVGFHHWVYRPDGVLFSVRGGIDKAPREQVNDIVSAQDRIALGITDPAFAGDDIVNAPAFQQRQRTLWASTPAMRYRAWREYRDRSASLVLLGETNPNPTLAGGRGGRAGRRSTAPPAGGSRASNQRTVWADGIMGDTYVAYSIEGRPIVLDLAGDAATYRVTWVDGLKSATRQAAPVTRAGDVVTLTPPSRDSRESHGASACDRVRPARACAHVA